MVVRHHLTAWKEARVHNLYLLLLQLAIPHSTVHVTLGELSRRAGISITTVKRYLKTIAEQKPWLSFRPAGRAGIAIYYRPDQTKPRKQTKKRPSSSLESSSSLYRKDSINDAERHKSTPNPRKITPPTPKTKLPRGKIWSPQEWERRHWMKLWRRKSYTDPSLKWAIKNGADLVRIIGHFTWHAKVEFSTIKAAVKRWWQELLYAGKALPAGGKALFQCLFVRLKAWIHKLSIKNVNEAKANNIYPVAGRQNANSSTSSQAYVHQLAGI
jgi:hypothetical protein